MKISIPSRRSPFKKLIALITLFCFLLQNTALAMPAGLDRPSSGLSLPPIQIPAGWGSVRASSERRDGPLVIHLEDAHGDYAAQKNIGRIIRHLRDVYGVRLVLAEGAHVRLEPGVFRPFSDRALNLKTADALMRRGEFTGAEKFLLEAEGDPVRRMEAYGIEDPELYRRDFELFVGILGAAEDSAGFAGRMQSRIESAATRVLSPELRAFWREWQKFEATHSGPLRFIGTLRAAARRSLGLDLEDPAQQKRYPSLLRVLKLGELEKKLRPRKIADERKALLRFLDGKIEKRLWRRLRALDVSGLKDSGANPRFLFEKIAEQAGAKGLDFRRYPHYAEFAAYAIFQAEIESQELFLEIRELSDRLFEALAKTEEERGLIALGKDLALVKKLLSLELSRDELQEAAARRQELAPGRLKERLAALEPGLLPDSELAADPLTLRFEEAFEFYRLAEAREKSFADKAAALLHEKKAGRCVLITGGYHTEGLGTLLKERGIAHTIVTPRVGAPEKSHALYLEAMLGKSHIVKGLRLVPERERVRLLGSAVVGRDAALDRSVAAEVRAAALGAAEAPVRASAQKTTRFSLYSELSPAEKKRLAPKLREWKFDVFARGWTGGVLDALIAYVGREPAGVQQFMRHEESLSAYASGLHVDVKFRRNGHRIGSRLIDKLLTGLKKEGFKEFDLVGVDKTPESQGFHRARIRALEGALFSVKYADEARQIIQSYEIDLSRYEPASSSLGAQKDSLIARAVSLTPFGAQEFEADLAAIEALPPAGPLGRRIPNNLPPAARAALRQALAGDFQARVVANLRAKLASGRIVNAVIPDASYRSHLGDESGPGDLAWAHPDGRIIFLNKFHAYLAQLRLKDADEARRLTAGLLARLSVEDLLGSALAAGAPEVTAPVREAVEKIAALYERRLAGDSWAGGDSAATALSDFSRGFIYLNRFDRQADLRRDERFARSKPSRAEKVMDAFDAKLHEIVWGYYENRKYYQQAGRETGGIQRMRQKFLADFKALRENLRRENFNGLSEKTLRGIDRLGDADLLEWKIKRYAERYEEILGRIERYAGDETKRGRLERLNREARDLLSRLVLFEMHPARIDRYLERPQILPESAEYQMVFERFRLLRYHLSSFRRELMWLRVREAGRKEVVRYVSERGRNLDSIGDYLLSPEFFAGMREEGTEHPKFLEAAIAEGGPDAGDVKDTIQKLLEGGQIEYERRGYKLRAIHYKKTIDQLLRPYWAVAGFRETLVERLKEEGVQIRKPAAALTVENAVELFTSGRVYEEQLAGVLLAGLEEFLLSALPAGEERETMERNFDENAGADVSGVGAELVTARYRHIFDLLRSYNHTLSSYADANVAGYEMLGYFDDALNRLKAIRRREFRNLPNLERAERTARRIIRADLVKVLEWARRGIKPSRRLPADEILAALTALAFEDDKNFERLVRWARFHVEIYIDENIRISKFTALKAMHVRDRIRKPVQILLKGAQVSRAVQEIERIRDQFFPARFQGPGYSRARERVRKILERLGNQDGRTVLFARDRAANNAARRRYVEILVELEMLLFDIIYKYTPDEEFKDLEVPLKREIALKILDGKSLDQVTFTRETLRNLHNRITRAEASSLGEDFTSAMERFGMRPEGRGRMIEEILDYEESFRAAGPKAVFPGGEPIRRWIRNVVRRYLLAGWVSGAAEEGLAAALATSLSSTVRSIVRAARQARDGGPEKIPSWAELLLNGDALPENFRSWLANGGRLPKGELSLEAPAATAAGLAPYLYGDPRVVLQPFRSKEEQGFAVYKAAEAEGNGKGVLLSRLVLKERGRFRQNIKEVRPKTTVLAEESAGETDSAGESRDLKKGRVFEKLSLLILHHLSAGEVVYQRHVPTDPLLAGSWMPDFIWNGQIIDAKWGRELNNIGNTIIKYRLLKDLHPELLEAAKPIRVLVLDPSEIPNFYLPEGYEKGRDYDFITVRDYLKAAGTGPVSGVSVARLEGLVEKLERNGFADEDLDAAVQELDGYLAPLTVRKGGTKLKWKEELKRLQALAVSGPEEVLALARDSLRRVDEHETETLRYTESDLQRLRHNAEAIRSAREIHVGAANAENDELWRALGELADKTSAIMEMFQGGTVTAGARAAADGTERVTQTVRVTETAAPGAEAATRTGIAEPSAPLKAEAGPDFLTYVRSLDLARVERELEILKQHRSGQKADPEDLEQIVFQGPLRALFDEVEALRPGSPAPARWDAAALLPEIRAFLGGPFERDSFGASLRAFFERSPNPFLTLTVMMAVFSQDRKSPGIDPLLRSFLAEEDATDVFQDELSSYIDSLLPAEAGNFAGALSARAAEILLEDPGLRAAARQMFGADPAFSFLRNYGHEEWAGLETNEAFLGEAFRSYLYLGRPDAAREILNFARVKGARPALVQTLRDELGRITSGADEVLGVLPAALPGELEDRLVRLKAAAAPYVAEVYAPRRTAADPATRKIAQEEYETFLAGKFREAGVSKQSPLAEKILAFNIFYDFIRDGSVPGAAQAWLLLPLAEYFSGIDELLLLAPLHEELFAAGTNGAVGEFLMRASVDLVFAALEAGDYDAADALWRRIEQAPVRTPVGDSTFAWSVRDAVESLFLSERGAEDAEKVIRYALDRLWSEDSRLSSEAGLILYGLFAGTPDARTESSRRARMRSANLEFFRRFLDEFDARARPLEPRAFLKSMDSLGRRQMRDELIRRAEAEGFSVAPSEALMAAGRAFSELIFEEEDQQSFVRDVVDPFVARVLSEAGSRLEDGLRRGEEFSELRESVNFLRAHAADRGYSIFTRTYSELEDPFDRTAAYAFEDQNTESLAAADAVSSRIREELARGNREAAAGLLAGYGAFKAEAHVFSYAARSARNLAAGFPLPYSGAVRDRLDAALLNEEAFGRESDGFFEEVLSRYPHRDVMIDLAQQFVAEFFLADKNTDERGLAEGLFRLLSLAGPAFKFDGDFESFADEFLRRFAWGRARIPARGEPGYKALAEAVKRSGGVFQRSDLPADFQPLADDESLVFRVLPDTVEDRAEWLRLGIGLQPVLDPEVLRKRLPDLWGSARKISLEEVVLSNGLKREALRLTLPVSGVLAVPFSAEIEILIMPPSIFDAVSKTLSKALEELRSAGFKSSAVARAGKQIDYFLGRKELEILVPLGFATREHFLTDFPHFSEPEAAEMSRRREGRGRDKAVQALVRELEPRARALRSELHGRLEESIRDAGPFRPVSAMTRETLEIAIGRLTSAEAVQKILAREPDREIAGARNLADTELGARKAETEALIRKEISGDDWTRHWQDFNGALRRKEWAKFGALAADMKGMTVRADGAQLQGRAEILEGLDDTLLLSQELLRSGEVPAEHQPAIRGWQSDAVALLAFGALILKQPFLSKTAAGQFLADPERLEPAAWLTLRQMIARQTAGTRAWAGDQAAWQNGVDALLSSLAGETAGIDFVFEGQLARFPALKSMPQEGLRKKLEGVVRGHLEELGPAPERLKIGVLRGETAAYDNLAAIYEMFIALDPLDIPEAITKFQQSRILNRDYPLWITSRPGFEEAIRMGVTTRIGTGNTTFIDMGKANTIASELLAAAPDIQRSDVLALVSGDGDNHAALIRTVLGRHHIDQDSLVPMSLVSIAAALDTVRTKKRPSFEPAGEDAARRVLSAHFGRSLEIPPDTIEELRQLRGDLFEKVAELSPAVPRPADWNPRAEEAAYGDLILLRQQFLTLLMDLQGISGTLRMNGQLEDVLQSTMSLLARTGALMDEKGPALMGLIDEEDSNWRYHVVGIQDPGGNLYVATQQMFVFEKDGHPGETIDARTLQAAPGWYYLALPEDKIHETGNWQIVRRVLLYPVRDESTDDSLWQPVEDQSLAVRALEAHFAMEVPVPEGILSEALRNLQAMRAVLEGEKRMTPGLRASFQKTERILARYGRHPRVVYADLLEIYNTLGQFIDDSNTVTARQPFSSPRATRRYLAAANRLLDNFNEDIFRVLPDVFRLEPKVAGEETQIVIGFVSADRLYVSTPDLGVFAEYHKPQNTVRIASVQGLVTSLPPGAKVLVIGEGLDAADRNPAAVRQFRASSLTVSGFQPLRRRAASAPATFGLPPLDKAAPIAEELLAAARDLRPEEFLSAISNQDPGTPADTVRGILRRNRLPVYVDSEASNVPAGTVEIMTAVFAHLVNKSENAAGAGFDRALGAVLVPGVIIVEDGLTEALNVVFPPDQRSRPLDASGWKRFLEVVEARLPAVYQRMDKSVMGRVRLNQAMKAEGKVYLDRAGVETGGDRRLVLSGLALVPGAANELPAPDFNFFMHWYMAAVSSRTDASSSILKGPADFEELSGVARRLIAQGGGTAGKAEDQRRWNRIAKRLQERSAELLPGMIRAYEHRFVRAEEGSSLGETQALAGAIFDRLKADPGYLPVRDLASRGKGQFGLNPPDYTPIWDFVLAELERRDFRGERREVVNRVIDLVQEDAARQGASLGAEGSLKEKLEGILGISLTDEQFQSLSGISPLTPKAVNRFLQKGTKARLKGDMVARVITALEEDRRALELAQPLRVVPDVFPRARPAYSLPSARGAYPPEIRPYADPSDADIQARLERLRESFSQTIAGMVRTQTSSDLTALKAQALDLNPGFASRVPDSALVRAWNAETSQLTMEMAEQLFLPLHEFVDFLGAAEMVRWQVDPDSWRAVPYLDSVIWTSTGKVHGEDRPDRRAFSAVRMVFLDPEALERAGRAEFQDLKTNAVFASPQFPMPFRLRQMIDNGLLREEDFARGIYRELAAREEYWHARDFALAERRHLEGLLGDITRDIKLVESVLKPDSWVRQSYWPRDLRWSFSLLDKALSVKEFSAKLEAARDLMDEHLAAGNKETAYAVFLVFLRGVSQSVESLERQPGLTPHEIHYKYWARLFVDSLPRTALYRGVPISSWTDILSRLENNEPAGSVAPRARRLLEDVFRQHFWTEKEKEARLPRALSLGAGERDELVAELVNLLNRDYPVYGKDDFGLFVRLSYEVSPRLTPLFMELITALNEIDQTRNSPDAVAVYRKLFDAALGRLNEELAPLRFAVSFDEKAAPPFNLVSLPEGQSLGGEDLEAVARILEKYGTDKEFGLKDLEDVLGVANPKKLIRAAAEVFEEAGKAGRTRHYKIPAAADARVTEALVRQASEQMGRVFEEAEDFYLRMELPRAYQKYYEVLSAYRSLKERLARPHGNEGLSAVQARQEAALKSLGRLHRLAKNRIGWFGRMGDAAENANVMSVNQVVDGETWNLGDPIHWVEAHRKGTRHATVHVILMTLEGEVVVQERPDGKMDISASGHVRPGDANFKEAALRLIQSETGLMSIGQHDLEPITDVAGAEKIGRLDFEGLPYYRDDVFYSKSGEWINREYGRFYVKVLTPEEERTLRGISEFGKNRDHQVRFVPLRTSEQSPNERGLVEWLHPEIPGDKEMIEHLSRFASPIQQFFLNPRNVELLERKASKRMLQALKDPKLLEAVHKAGRGIGVLGVSSVPRVATTPARFRNREVPGVIIFDVDKTLAERDARLAESMRRQIRALLKQGYRVAIITGQPINVQYPRLISDVVMREAEGASQVGGIEPLEKEELENLVIYANEGAQKYVFVDGEIREVEDYRKGSLTRKESKDKVKQMIRDLLKALKENEAPLDAAESALVTEPAVLQELIALVKKENPDWFDRDAIYSFKFKGFIKHPQTVKMRLLLKEILLKRFREAGIEDLDILTGGKSTVSIVPKGIDKTTALEDMMEWADGSRIVYFGDEFTEDGNDDTIRRTRLDPRKRAGEVTVVSVGVNKQGEPLNPPGTVWIGKGPAATESALSRLSGAEGGRAEAFANWVNTLYPVFEERAAVPETNDYTLWLRIEAKKLGTDKTYSLVMTPVHQAKIVPPKTEGLHSHAARELRRQYLEALTAHPPIVASPPNDPILTAITDPLQAQKVAKKLRREVVRRVAEQEWINPFGREYGEFLRWVETEHGAASSLGGEDAAGRPVRPSDPENSLVMEAPDFPPIDLAALGEREPIFEGIFHRQAFLDREERVRPMPYFGPLHFAKPALEEVVLNGLDAVARTGSNDPTVKVVLEAYEPDVYRLVVMQETSRPEDWANLKKRAEGFREQGPQFFVELRFPKDESLVRQTQRNNGFYNLARLMKDTPALLTYVRDPATGAVRTELLFRLAVKASSLGMSMKLLQTMEAKPIPAMRQIMEDEYLALERAVQAVWQKAAGRPDGIRRPAIKDLVFEYAAVRKSDAEGLAPGDAEAFARRLAEAGGAFLHYSETGRRYYLFADADLFPAEFIDLAGLHEYAESVLGSHYAATAIEFAAARLERKQDAYVEWIRANHAAKFANLATHVELEDEEFVPERVLKSDEYQDFRLRRKASPEAEKLKAFMAGSKWPRSLLTAVRRAEKENEALELAIEKLFKRSRDRVTELSRARPWPEVLKTLEAETRAELEKIRSFAEAKTLNANRLRKVWREQKRYTAGVAAASWAAYARMKGEKVAREELELAGLGSEDLNRYGIFRDSLDPVDLLTAPEKQWKAAASLGAVRAPLEFVLRIARPREEGGLTDGILFLPDAGSLEWALEALGLLGNRAARTAGASAAVRAFNGGELTERIKRRAGADIENPVPLVLYDSVFREDGTPVREAAGAISEAMEPKDLLVVIFGGDNKHEAIDRLIKDGNRRGFRVRTVPEKVATGGLIDSLIRSYSTDPVSVSALEESGDAALSYRGARVKLNLKELSASGVRPAALVGLIRQLADHPEKFRLAGFTQKDGYWEVGSEFVRLIEDLYAEQSAELARQRAA